MSQTQGYILGQSPTAARRLQIQDDHFAAASEALLNDLAVSALDRVVELGCGPGGLSRRILKRLGPDGTLVAVDASEQLLAQAQTTLAGSHTAKYYPTLADVSQLGSWLDGADVVVGRAILHHVPMAEVMLGRLRTRVKPGTRIGFIEPDFRSLVGKIAYLEANGQPELAPLRIWAMAINHLYLANRVSPDVGATLARTFEIAGYKSVKWEWSECLSDERMIENMMMFFDEVRERLQELGILTTAEVDQQQQGLMALSGKKVPAAWATFRVWAIA